MTQETAQPTTRALRAGGAARVVLVLSGMAVLLWAVAASMFIVDVTEYGVLLRFGAVVRVVPLGIAHVDIGLGQIELGRGFVPLRRVLAFAGRRCRFKNDVRGCRRGGTWFPFDLITGGRCGVWRANAKPCSGFIFAADAKINRIVCRGAQVK